MIKIFRGLALSLGASCIGVSVSFAAPLAQASQSQNAREPSLQTIANIEAGLKMPNGARLISDYVRYYSLEVSKRRKFIVATFVYDGSPGRIVLVDPENRRLIMDGGCNVIELRYSLIHRKVISISCNGIA